MKTNLLKKKSIARTEQISKEEPSVQASPTK